MRKILLLISMGFLLSGAYAQEKGSHERPSQVIQDNKAILEMKSDFINLTKEQKAQVLKVKNASRITQKDKLFSQTLVIPGEEKTKKPYQQQQKIERKERTKFERHDNLKIEVAQKLANINQKKATRDVIEQQHSLKSTKASAYLCGKMNDTTVNYSWQDAKWVAVSRTILIFSDYGKLEFELSQVYNTDSAKWINEEQYVLLYDANQNLTSETYSIWNSGTGSWDGQELYSFTYDGNGNMLTEAYKEYSGSAWEPVDSIIWTYTTANLVSSEYYLEWGGADWLFGYHESYTWDNSGRKTSETWALQDADGPFVPYVYFAFDVRGWDVNETDFIDTLGIITEYYKKDGYDDGTNLFAMGYREIVTYAFPNPFVFDLEVVGLADLLKTYTYQELDPEDNSWVNVVYQMVEEFDMYANYTIVVTQDSAGTGWVNADRQRVEYDYGFDCNGSYIGSIARLTEADVWDGSAWVQYYKKEYDPTYYDPAEYYCLIWDADSGKFTGHDGSGYIQYTWNYSWDYWDPVKTIVLDWDADAQEWINYTHEEITHGVIYRGGGTFGTYRDGSSGSYWLYYNYKIIQEWDPVEGEWIISELDTTYYNTDGYPTQYLEKELVGDDLVNAYQELYTYDAGGNLTSYTEQVWGGAAWENIFRELFAYISADSMTYTTENWTGTAWEGDERTLISFGTDSYTEVYQFWGGSAWENDIRVEWGDDWDIWEAWTGTEWEYVEWYFGQEFDWAAYVQETYGLKEWNSTDEEWDYVIYEYYDWNLNSNSTWINNYEYYYASGSDDGDRLVNQERSLYDYRSVYPYDELIDQLDQEWSTSSSKWIDIGKYILTYEGDDCEGYTDIKEEEYEWNAANGIWLRVGGYESYTEYEEIDGIELLVDTWSKMWSTGSLSGSRYTYDYTSDGYLETYIYQMWSSNDWANVSKTEYTWSGIADLQIGDGEVTNIDCYGDAAGAIDISVRGGTLPYTFLWTNGSTAEDLEDITAGNYAVTITDANGCVYRSEYVTIEQNVNISASITYQGASTPSTQPDPGIDGWATITVYGGVPPYTYLWSDWVGTTSPTMTDVKEGNYSCTVTDALGCSHTFDIYIPGDGSSGVVGVNEWSMMEIGIYPNPASDRFNLVLNSSFANARISVFDGNGKLVMNSFVKGQLPDGFTRGFDVSSLDNGIYMIRVDSDNNTLNTKLVIQK